MKNPFNKTESLKRVTDNINQRIAELQAEIQELQARLEPQTPIEAPEAPEALPNRLYNIVKEVTAYKAPEAPKQEYRTPTPKKVYQYTPPKTGDLIGIDKDGQPVYF